MNPTKYQVVLKDHRGNVCTQLQNKVRSLSWDWDRLGGCGACKMTVIEDFDGVLAGSFTEDYEVNIYMPSVSGTAELWYSGFIDSATPKIKAGEETFDIFALGYVNQLKRCVVDNMTYYGSEMANLAKTIIDTYVTPNTSITSTAANYEETDFSAEELYFNESAYDVITKLADLAGRREWGIGADKAFFFKKRKDTTTFYYDIKKDLSSYEPTKDFNPIITRIYLEGGNDFRAQYNLTHRRLALRSEIVSNSSIITRDAADRYARWYLKEHGKEERGYKISLVDKSTRIEASAPIGRVELFDKRGIRLRYTVANQAAGVAGDPLYDGGLKYDGGQEAFQVEKVHYVLTDTGVNVDLYLNVIPSSIADDFAKLEYMISTERNM